MSGKREGAPRDAAAAVREAAQPVATEQDRGPLLDRMGHSCAALIGEASHGTHEFYDMRAAITRRLIAEKGFRLVAVEADWPDALRVNRFVRLRSDECDARAALGDFQRFPRWMWRNTVLIDFIEWLREWNRVHPEEQAGFYGIDLYSLHASIGSVLDYLGRVDPDAARRARARYACFDHFGDDPQTYGYAAGKGLAESCEDEVVEQLLELQRRAASTLSTIGDGADEAELFYAEQNARLVANAERYYRSMFKGRAASWNLRDDHMAGTIRALMQRPGSAGRKIVVWAHNSHLGDARATEMGDRGEINVGQRVREMFGESAFLLGFSTYDGTVTAARDWDEQAERRNVRPGLPGSYEAVFHATGVAQFWLDLRRAGDELREALAGPLLQRAIGVIYRPETERRSHYFEARVAEQFDAIIHLDRTTALRPLDSEQQWDRHELPETFPSGL